MSKAHHGDDQNNITSSQKQMAVAPMQRGCGCKKTDRSLGKTHELKQSNEAFAPTQSFQENQERGKEVKTRCCRSKAL